ncbi:deoxyribonuclease-like protein tatD [Mollisia scopiformis]|uniref:Deoxyribonuclease-like protein tatD n=1 Tax=Mollisia scopiformis TaxID=149040 RepID=A0A132B2F9_MOLSC|nr:deoxyribonuclease-like protein tatD [Mollisia scopiformis]KUJ06580.1 deoxyribonuclease-like protein tatD [Mollisia scopiformis]
MATEYTIEAAASASQSSVPITNGVKKLYKPRYIDIGINLTDPVFTGLYYGTQRHPNDLSGVLQRAKEAGCEKLIVTGSDLKESRKAVQLAKEHPRVIYATIGVHPCNCSQFTKSPSPSTILDELRAMAVEAKASNHAVAFGEIGLDYDRLEHCPKEEQLKYFEAQLSLATEVQLPLFLHSRAAHADFIRILSSFSSRLPRKGVVHSFTGTKEEMWDLVEKGWDIGVNGCSMKTAENCEVVREVPLDRLQVETDGPWCEMRASHVSADFLLGMGVGPKAEEEEEEDQNGELKEWKSVKKERWAEGLMIKGRNEPCMIGHVAWAIAGIKGISVKQVSEAAWANSVRMFGVAE